MECGCCAVVVVAQISYTQSHGGIIYQSIKACLIYAHITNIMHGWNRFGLVCLLPIKPAAKAIIPETLENSLMGNMILHSNASENKVHH